MGYVIKPNLPVLGPKLGKRLGAVRTALTALRPGGGRRYGAARVRSSVWPWTAKTKPLLLAPDEVLVETKQKEGYVVEQDKGLVVALDTTLTEELRAGGRGPRPGAPRQRATQVGGLRHQRPHHARPMSWRTATASPPGRRLQALDRFGPYVQQETLSLGLDNAAPPPDAFTQQEQLDGVDLVLSVCRSA